MRRRAALQLIAGGTAHLFARRPLWAAAETRTDEFFVFVHAAGGWDVTLCLDPRNERKGLVEPPSTENTDIAGLRHWKGASLDGGAETFEPLVAGELRLGPAIGPLWDLRDRLTVVNGLEMNTVSHPDGVAYAITGRHLQGGRATQPSLDVVLASELGTTQLLPGVAIQFPTSYVGDHLDRRAIPLRVNSAATIARQLARSDAYFDAADRAAITALLTAEAQDLAKRSVFPETYERLAGQHAAQPGLMSEELRKAFVGKALQDKYPRFDYKSKAHGAATLGAAFAIEAMRRNLVRCASFALGGLDTHGDNYKKHAQLLQELFAVVASLVHELDATPHPTRAGARLSHHTHVLVFSDFCRTPQISLAGGRDHYPNNSALVISPRFRGGRAFGKTDVEQLLPADPGRGRPLSPPDLLATFVAAFGIDPRRYLRDGDVLDELLR